MLKLGVDAWNLPNDRRGIGRYLRALLRAWHEVAAERVACTLVVPEWHTWTVRERYRREAPERRYPVVSRALHRLAGLDLLWFPWNGVGWSGFDTPAVATLHDAAYFTEAYRNEGAQGDVRRAAARCAHLIADSAFTARELVRYLQIPPEGITPVLLGVDSPAAGVAAGSSGIVEPYVFFVGTAERRKGLDVLARAMVQVQRERPELLLVVAGSGRDAAFETSELRVRELGFVDDARLAALYGDATLFAFPSRYEGFGLPVLEAMRHGTPVVCSDAASLPEVGGDAAMYAPVGDPDALARAILHVASDAALAGDLRERGLRRAAEMSWHRTALQTLDVLERVARA
ncbi:MAG: glycosyltransferase family 4 protein [bacterium]|nr:glycosyltransferase family 4 protein [bacterium]